MYYTEPQLGLGRNDDGEVTQPGRLVVVNEDESGTPLPPVGVVLNF
ncbi:MAG: hypothetical protein MJA30_04380 [Cytophagales bacterium]|nr:hypothetical protein [Cytophagales bacterium]